LGRPRLLFKHFIVFSELDRETFERFHQACHKEGISARKAVAAMVRGWLDDPLYIVKYKDPLFLQRISDPENYPIPVRECYGKVLRESSEDIEITCDQLVDGSATLQVPQGPNILKLPRGCILEIRRLGSQ
jgi:hypothetical protein